MQRIIDILLNAIPQHNKSDFLAYKKNGEWLTVSASEAISTINSLSLGLLDAGIKKDDKVAIISNNRPEWNIVDFAIQQIGAVSVPMYPTITIEDYKYIFKDSGAKLVFVSDKDLYTKAKAAADSLDPSPSIYCFNEISGLPNWKELWSKKIDFSVLEPLRKAVKPDDLLTIIYTSGTTGTPKGVMLTQQNIASNVMATDELFPIDNESRALSFLPLCHIYERMALYVYMNRGVSVYYAESMDTVAQNLQEVKPHMFTTVPRLLEKVYDKIVAKGYHLGGIKQKLFLWALDLGLKYDPNEKKSLWYRFQLNWANKLVFSKWREALGGNVRLICSGSAALQPRLARVFWAAGIPVSEGYGLTETSPVVSANFITPLDLRVGTVGRIIDGVEVKFAEDGEILVKGPNVMKGYYNNPTATAEAIVDGWFHTGDIGELIEGRFLKITDRKKEIFKTSGGKYIVPQKLENKLKESPFIEQVCIVGDGQKFASALIVADFETLKVWCKSHEIAAPDMKTAVSNTAVKQKIMEEVEQFNTEFAQYERVKKIALMPHAWGIETGEMTPTLKLKRKNIASKYKEMIDGLY